MTQPPRILSLALLLLAACGTGEDAPEQPPNIVGHYVITGSQRDTSCNVAPALDDIYAFSELAANGVPAWTLDIEQSSGDLTAVLGPAGCDLSGGVAPGGALNLSGPCDDALMGRDVTISANVTGSANYSFSGVMRIDVDFEDGAGGGPDDVVDCSVESVDLNGTGSPPE